MSASRPPVTLSVSSRSEPCRPWPPYTSYFFSIPWRALSRASSRLPAQKELPDHDHLLGHRVALLGQRLAVEVHLPPDGLEGLSRADEQDVPLAAHPSDSGIAHSREPYLRVGLLVRASRWPGVGDLEVAPVVGHLVLRP